MPNVSLVAPPAGGLPTEQQATLQQLQIQEQLAQALLGKSLEQGPAVIHTGGSNPFARDVINWGGPMSAIANAFFGRANLADVAPKIADVYKKAEDVRQQDIAGVMQTLEGGQTAGPYEGGSIFKKPSVVGAAALAAKSSHPAVQAIGDSLLKAWTEGKMKSLATGDQIGGMMRNAAASSIPGALTEGPFGTEWGNIANLRNKGELTGGEGGAKALISPDPLHPYAIGQGMVVPPPYPPVQPGQAYPTTTPGAVSQPGVGGAGSLADIAAAAVKASGGPAAGGGADVVTNALAPQPGAPTAINTSGGTMSGGPGAPTVLRTPTTIGAEDAAKTHLETLKTGKAQALEFTDTAPKLLKALELLPNADMGIGGDVVTKARQWAKRFGLSDDELNKIGDTQSFLKTMMSPATGAARAFNSRATQMEFVQFLKAFAASQDTDPRAAVNIVTQMLLDGYNQASEHNRNIEQLKTEPGVERAESFRVQNFPSIEHLTKEMDKVGLKTDIRQDPETGQYTDAMAAKRGVDPYWAKPSDASIEHLKKNHQLRELYDERYGLGASDKIIGPATE